MADSLKLTTEGVQPTPFQIPGSRGQFRIQILNEDAGRGVVTSIVHIPAGGFIPAHYHQAGAEMHYLLEGDLSEAGERLAPGAFLTQAPGVVHGPQESQGGCKVLTVQQWQSLNGEFDFHIVEQPAQGGTSGGAAAPAKGNDTPRAASSGDTPRAASGGDAPMAAEGVPTESRSEAERSLGRGYG